MMTSTQQEELNQYDALIYNSSTSNRTAPNSGGNHCGYKGTSQLPCQSDNTGQCTVHFEDPSCTATSSKVKLSNKMKSKEYARLIKMVGAVGKPHTYLYIRTTKHS